MVAAVITTAYCGKTSYTLNLAIMSPAATTFRLIILNDAQGEAERLISMFNNAGKPCRAHYINEEQALAKLLEEQSWDLLIAHDATQGVTPATAIKLIRKMNRDLPVILLTDDESSASTTAGMKLGANDVIRLDDDQHLLLATSRELENRQHRQDTRRAERRLKEVERRNQQLLDSSRDGIAFVQDGMYLYANDSFAELFGYNDIDDIECMPIMDMISEQDHENVKRSLKDFSLQQDKHEKNTLSFNAISHSGTHKSVTLELHLSHYDDEPCIQFLLPAKRGSNDVLEAEIEVIKHIDQATGLYNRQHMLEVLEDTVDNATNQEQSTTLLYIDIDQYVQKVQAVVGISCTDAVLAAIAGFIQRHTENGEVNARFADSAFTCLLPSGNMETAIARANTICNEVAEHLFEIENKTLQLTLSIGIALINETSTDGQSVIDQSLKAIEQLRKNNDGIGNGAYVFQHGGGEDKTIIISSIQKALNEEQFRLLFQPIISLRGDDIEHYEVLLRMINDDGEEISPDHFLDTAEAIKACDKIDRWVILETIKSLSEHRKNGSNTQVIINLSSSSVCDDSLAPWLKVAFKASELPPEAVIFQVKEADIIQHLTATRHFVEQLHEIGALFSISRFGCALNPMNALEHVDADHIKVDGSFTQEMQDHPDKSEALDKLMSQLHERQKITIVPLVENASILSKLWQMGVHYIQGHYLQAPADGMNYDFNLED